MSSHPALDSIRDCAAVFFDTRRACISVTGDDRLSWLNGVLTCDLADFAKSSGNHAAYGCALNVKGRVLADAIVVASGKRLAAFVPRTRVQSIIDLWNGYIVMEDCEIALDETHALVTLQGGKAVEVASAVGVASRGAKLDVLGTGEGLVFDVERAESEEIVKRLVHEGAVPLEEGDLNALRVEAARGTHGIDFDDHNYVQEAGLEERAVSFRKGCYVGQEVVCMLQNRGKVHKRLVKLSLASTHGVIVGAEVKTEAAVVGTLTSLLLRDDGSALGLAMIKTSASTPGTKLEIAGNPAEVVAEAG